MRNPFDMIIMHVRVENPVFTAKEIDKPSHVVQKEVGLPLYLTFGSRGMGGISSCCCHGKPNIGPNP